MGTFPEYKAALTALVEEHKKLAQKTLLALYFESPPRCPDDVCLLEVVEGFGGGDVDPYREWFEVVYAAKEAFPNKPGHDLRLILTNPAELDSARAAAWRPWQELNKAIESKQYEVLHQEGSSWLEKLREQTAAA